MIESLDVVRNARARHMRLAVHPATGRIRLTLPKRASLKAGLAWAESQRGWIDRQRARLPERILLGPGARFPFRGEMLTIAWSRTRSRTPVIAGDMLVCGGPEETLAGRVERWLRAQALSMLREETLEVAERANVAIERVSVGDPRSRWGSCSSRGTIRYSWRLILAPDSVRRATVAHEVAHRVHMNHGPDFHRLVKALYGADPAPARQWLRANGAALHWIGGA
ncbi:M48 family metallopeptidase [Stakelama tenebrarum]|uniref:M48 family metallopeptidase n=1 Tax=Stakelama tenebrarum TaxID=2711215 RepID=A0A6G6Y139_9SPHN|nr:SprT family zinc-dependent metalloprotease [Sphingosinithalassobacter tenebrarum]QIG78527.1 M48 family metallopeptidase [Sphingosinithalassobacter tenebrarum]